MDRREWDILATDPRVGVKGNRGADERERNYGQKTKRNLVSKQLFWWEVGIVGKGSTIEIKTFSLASYVLIAASVPSCGSEDQLSLAELWLLSDGDWLRPAGTGSDSMVPTVPPLRKN